MLKSTPACVKSAEHALFPFNLSKDVNRLFLIVIGDELSEKAFELVKVC